MLILYGKRSFLKLLFYFFFLEFVMCAKFRINILGFFKSFFFLINLIIEEIFTLTIQTRHDSHKVTIFHVWSLYIKKIYN